MEEASQYYRKSEKKEKGETPLKQVTDLAFVLQRTRPGWGQWARRFHQSSARFLSAHSFSESLALD